MHSMEVRNARRLLFVSGTMGLDPTGAAGATWPVEIEVIAAG
ncbi:hypothetical protein [Planotetraspora kaengkrachanensis]|nr:hypothetical protein [Planotetraspora kaengkrachanensis]